ncbi:ADP-ribosylglycohydrolase family protein [Argonema antarcticum]|uniref:ADP-ribosylglycohydrolase family protein n=1 Tax=Argonema antarcticum TaxID=2942763 RepID=UPI0020125ADD|nr:ADP-ribosylglycohydrolase family protein [Argonema antarcticum]MCL1469649.1 ADP-ribosylglycohydrolase family protein [Argonema antarcticum A004/B2]
MNNEDSNKINRVSLITKGQGAFLGAAVGDALGWPQEPEAKRVDKKTGSTAEYLSNGFQQWVRKSGGQYYPHEEVILAGEYSDDTQLILSTARSLLYGQQWFHHLTQRELPTWTCYERGGGGATKRAAKEWLNGIEPWSSPKNKKQYFDAGGNGVAMRILPHCLLGATESNFEKIAKNIIANGVCTHGHPRALVGALAYGFAVWVAFRETGTLQYGAIIEQVLSGVNCWSVIPDLDDICPTWKLSARELNAGQYKKHWQVTVEEMLQLLKQCQEAMKQGALSVEREVLTKMGCFDKNIKGAGTVSAAASIFLASRYAADPLHGLLEAGFAHGADTDTIASMTGGILGAIAGIEWLGNYAEQVQDATYIRGLAEHLAKNQGTCKTKQADNIKTTKPHLDSLLEKIEISKDCDTVLIPDGREAQISATQNHHSSAKSTVAVSRKLTTADGQSLYIKKVSRTKNDAYIKTETSNIATDNNLHEIELQPVKVVNSAVKLPVRNMTKARFFYEKVLGLKVEKESKAIVRCDCIVLVPSDYQKNHMYSSPNLIPNTSTTIYIELESLDEAHNNVRQFGSKILKPISERRGRRFFTCLDPDGNAVEIFEVDF